MESSKFTSKPIFAVIILCLLAGLLFVSQKNKTLTQKYEDLLNSSKKLEASIAELESKNDKLSAQIQRFDASAGDAQRLRAQFEEEVARIKKENETLQFEMSKAQETMKSAIEEKSYLEDILINKSKEIETLKNQSPPAPAAGSASAVAPAPENGGSPAQISAAIAQKDEEIKKLTDQNIILSEKLDRLYQVTNAKITEIQVAKIALEETLSNAKQTIDQEWGTVHLGTISVASPSPSVWESKPEARTGPKKEGKILAINEAHGFVVVDLGKIDNIPPTAGLTVEREGKNIATLTVLEVRDVMTACNIKHLADGEKIQINDLVLIQK